MKPALELADALRIQARANRLANHRLHAAMAALPRSDFQAPRASFFASLAATLNHLVAVDGYYLDALTRTPDAPARYRAFRPAPEVAELAARQAASDARLIAFCEALDAAGCAAEVEMDRGDHVQRDLAAHVLAHLFMHQTHHRGQAHAMLAGTAIAPPQLDEFLMPSEAHLRTDDMTALGWTESEVFGR